MEDEIQQFMAITGSDREVAERMLEACNGNIELAIEMHLDTDMGQSAVQGMSNFNSSAAADNRPNIRPTVPPDVLQDTGGMESDSSSSSGFQAGGDESVRAPIPQMRAVLVEDPYHAIPYQRGRQRQQHRSVFDGFRDFQAEARRQEELLNQAEAVSPEETTNKSKIKTLQDLFRPPVDIIFKGTFEAAKEAGALQKKWLMVNIQDVKEFACQVLNRDVWSNVLVRDLIQEHFILWQVYHDSEEGQRFMIYYPVKNFPNISIIDPRTGECLIVWDRFEKMDSQLFCDLVTQFLAAHPDLITENEFPPEKKQKTDSVIEEPEDKQLAAAIAASLQDDNLKGWSESIDDSSEDKDDDDEIESFEYSDDESCSSKEKPARLEDKASINNEINQCTKRFKANSLDKKASSTTACRVIEEGEDESKLEVGDSFKCNGAFTKLMLRLPEGNRKQIRMLVDASLKELADYISSIGFPTPDYEIVTNFPRRNLTDVESTKTLKEANLFPQETIFVQER